MAEIDWSIIKKSIHGTLSDEEQKLLDMWLEESEEHRIYYRKTEKFQRNQQRYKGNRKQQFERFKNRVGIVTPKPIYNYMRYAAAIAVLAISGYLATSYYTQKNEPKQSMIADASKILPGWGKAQLQTSKGESVALTDTGLYQITLASGAVTKSVDLIEYTASQTGEETVYHTITTPRGGEFSVKLADGTLVYLNSESRLTFPVPFSAAKRSVTLEGEGYFEVAHNEKQPFVVTAQGCHVTVLGTRFNVSAYATDEQTTTTLVDGKVQVSLNDMLVGLNPNEQCIITDNQIVEKVSVDAELYVAWKNGRFVFDNKPLAEIITQLERWYNVSFTYEQNDLRGIRFTGNISRQLTLDEILEKIDKMNEVYFIAHNNIISIHKQIVK